MIEKRVALPAMAPRPPAAPAAPVASLALTVVASQRPGPGLYVPTAAEARDACPKAPPGVAYVPTEDVLLLTVQLPVMSASQRRQSVAFAVEDRIAQPLDKVQVVLGPELAHAKGSWLVAVVGRDSLSAVLSAAGRGPAPRVLPDVLALPRPAAGWAVWVGAGRALVRQSDGAGFAVRLDLLSTFWGIAGRPPVTLFGGTLPADVAATANAALPDGPEAALAGFDLSSGWKTGSHPAWPRDVRALVVIVGAAVFAHLALLAVDVGALGRAADSRNIALRDALSASGHTVDGDLDAAVAAMLAARQPAVTGGFLPLMQRAFVAMAPEAGRVTLRDLRYTRSDNSAVLTIEAPDIETLQGLEQAFGNAGLGVATGAATTGDGAANAEMTLRGDGS